jgi:bacterioferritin-associated ferredoxin
MDPHDDICLCFHVSAHKIEKFVRIEKPKLPSQISECYGAGTGCGWCIPFLERIFETTAAGGELDLKLSPTEYSARRKSYRDSGSPKNKFRSSERNT